jgi:hypothetical protein
MVKVDKERIVPQKSGVHHPVQNSGAAFCSSWDLEAMAHLYQFILTCKAVDMPET